MKSSNTARTSDTAAPSQGRSTIRIKAIFKESKFVVPCAIDETVSRLGELIAERAQRILGLPKVPKIHRLLTGDQFELDFNDRVVDVLEGGECVRAIDTEEFVLAEEQLCDLETPWLKVEREDFKDDKKKWACLGSHKRNKIYVRLFQEKTDENFGASNAKVNSKSSSTFDLFGPDDIRRIGKGVSPQEKEKIIARTESRDKKWFAEAKWIIEPKEKKVTGVQLSVKSSSDRCTWSDFISISVDDLTGRISKGDIRHISGSDNEIEEEEVNYEFPPPVRSGPNIVINPPIELKKHEPIGDADLTLKCDTNTDVSQDSWAREGSFNNYFVNVLTIINMLEKPTAIVKTSAEYEVNGKWVAANRTVIGEAWPQRFGFRYNWLDNSTSFTLEGKQTMTLAVSCVINVKGTPGIDNYFRSRAHKSLPQPMCIRITFETDSGKKKSIICEQANSPLDLPTQEKQEKSWGVKILHFVWCDDVEKESRRFAAVYKEGGKAVIRLSNSYYYFDDEQWKSIAFKAQSAVKPEWELENMKEVRDDFEQHVWVMVDLERANCYGLKFLLKTKTSTVIECVPIPKKKKGPTILRVTPEGNPLHVKPNQDITVTWKVPEAGKDDWIALYKVGESNNNSYLTYQKTGDTDTGSIVFKAPPDSAEYEFRYLPNNSYVHTATSEKIIVE